MNPQGHLIREVPPHDRPRERLERLGASALSDAELLAVLLRTGKKGMSAVDLGRKLVQRFGSLDGLARQSISEITKVEGIGKAKATLLKAAFAIHERVQSVSMQWQPFDSPQIIYDYMIEKTRSLQVEVLFGLALDTKMRLIRYDEITRGILNQTLVHSREVFREAISAAAAYLILAHNHPSGDPTPSADDVRTTREMAEAGKILGIPLLDHVILGKSHPRHPRGYVSMKEMGILMG